MPVALLLQRVERNGVLIDTAALNAQAASSASDGGAGARAHELAGQPFNIGSPKQIGDVLFTKLAMPVLRRTASGTPSTDEEVLEKLAEDYPLPARILEHRSLAKLKAPTPTSCR